MSLYEYNKGYADGYETAYKEMRSFLNSKDISPIDEMYGRYATMDESMINRNVYMGATGSTGPSAYMP